MNVDTDSNISEINWHNIGYDETLKQLASSADGLSSEVSQLRLQQYGSNQIKPQKKQSAFVRFLEQFNNILIYVLLVSGVITLLLGHWVDSSVIFGVVFINAVIGFIQEGKAEKALDAIRNILSQQTMVKRDGKFVTLPASTLVPGDIVLLQSGDKVPADLRLFKSRELHVDEAMLTGESVPVHKNNEVSPVDAPVADRKCMAYSGTLVTYGQAQGIVVATGDSTEIGRISSLLSHVQVLTTPLLRQMASFAKWLTVAIGILALVTFIFGTIVQSYHYGEMFIAAVGLAVAGIPEGLPAVMTITLAIGVKRMASKNAIIRRLPAVETLGSVTVICSDKTGTLTRNEMTAQTVLTGDGNFEISGVGYDPHGNITLNEVDITQDGLNQLRDLSLASLLCNDARITESDGQWTVHGDPTEAALVTMALKVGLDQNLSAAEYPRTDVIPFESQHRFMATLHHDHAGHGFIYVKGAPEEVLGMCQYQRVQGEDLPLKLADWKNKMHDLADRGQRLLAIAFKTTRSDHEILNFDDAKNDLTLLGIVGLIDPPRQEAIDAVHTCQSAGIRVKMITGDHAITARAIGKQMGIGDGETVLSGTELAQFSDEELLKATLDCDIFARVSPEQKLQLVSALQAAGEIVAMTGDGVNDAPALKRAEVGIAMGNKGTEVAKESAEMVLVDDNFASITRAVEEGRTVYDNLKKSILFILPTNGGEALMIVAAILTGRALPITAAQILWINMVTAVTLALTLAFEPTESNVMKRPPRRANEPLLSRFLAWRVLFVSLILVAGTFGLFIWERNNGASLELARTVAVNTLVMFEIFYLFTSRYLVAPSLTIEGITGNRYVLYAIGILIIIQLGFTYLYPMQVLFSTTAMSTEAWIRVIIVSCSVLFLVELEKAWLRHRAISRAGS